MVQRTASLILEDIRCADGSPARKLLGLAILDPLLLIVLCRVGHGLHNRGVRLVPWLIKAASGVLYGTDIHPGASFGPRLRFAHTRGIVVGEGVRAGADLEIYGGVTLGHRGNWTFPILGDRVTLFAGCCVLGMVSIGDDAQIGANAVVLLDVPAGRTAVGVPARIL